MHTDIICKGTAIFISFFTPESEVYVDEPVKFIARNDDKPAKKMNHEIVSIKLQPSILLRNRTPATKIPPTNPFIAKLLNGIYGSNNGVITNPVK